MQTNFSLAQLADPAIRDSESILRTCVHCGFCTATCPTYVLLGDELDSPRGRIYLIKHMLENAQAASATVVKHVDRCLSCLGCMTTCPSGVHYAHLVDHARVHIERSYRRPWGERALRRLLGTVLPSARLFRMAMIGALLARPIARLLPGRLAGAIRLAPRRLAGPSPVDRPATFAAVGERRLRVALLAGCVQQVLAPAVNAATVRVLTRLGCEVVVARGAGCCGALNHHLGQQEQAHSAVRANIAAWSRELEGGGLDAVVVTASGCGTMVKDYGFLVRDDAVWAERGRRVAGLARDVSEVIADLPFAAQVGRTGAVGRLKVAYHAACSLHHGQAVTEQPRDLLEAAGFDLAEAAEGHLCCGSAGTYNLLQPEIAARLRDRKVAHLEALAPDLIAAGNIGCMVQIASATAVPVAHTVELLDWATGGPRPAALDAGIEAL